MYSHGYYSRSMLNKVDIMTITQHDRESVSKLEGRKLKFTRGTRILSHIRPTWGRIPEQNRHHYFIHFAHVYFVWS